MIKNALISDLLQYSNFQLDVIATRLGIPIISLEAVNSAIERDYLIDEDRDSDYHLGRILYLMRYPEKEPLEIDMGDKPLVSP